jgi:hypothetical protein
MAKTRTTAVDNTDEEAETQAQAEDFAALNQATGGDLFAAVDELRAAGSGDVVFIVNRITPVESKGYCGKIPISKFDLEAMKTLYGPGRYMVQIKGPKGFLPGGGPVEIAPTPEAAKPAGGEFASYLELVDRREAERRTRTDDWIKLAMASAAPIIAAWVARPATGGTDIAALVAALKPAPGPSLADLSTAMVNMKTLSEPKESGGTVDTVLKVFEAAQSMMGDKEDSGKPGSSWIDVIRDLIKSAPDAIKPMLEARMAAMQAARGGAAPVQQNPPQIQNTKPIQPASQPAPTPPKDANMLEMFMPLIKVNLAKVAGWAEKNRDPEIYADVLVDELPDNFGSYIPLSDVLNYLNHAQWFENIVSIEPRLSGHRDWCDECRLAVIEIMKEFEKEAAGDEVKPMSAEASTETPIVNTAEN